MLRSNAVSQSPAITRILFVFAILFFLSGTAVSAAGVMNFDIPASPAGPAIRVLVWTPCAEPPQEMDARGATFFAVPRCPVGGEKLPLIVMSHGRRGWFGGHHDTAAALADAGFVVAALNHPGDTMRDTSGTDSLSVLIERPTDMKRLVDYMLDAWPDASRIDAQRIGLYGFSFGGYTGLVVIGGDPHLRKGLPYCETSSLKACRQLENGEIPDQPITHDPRVKAAVIIDPYPAFVFTEDSLKGIAVPIQLWSSDPAQKPTVYLGAVQKLSIKGFRSSQTTISWKMPNTFPSSRPVLRRMRSRLLPSVPMLRASIALTFIRSFTRMLLAFSASISMKARSRSVIEHAALEASGDGAARKAMRYVAQVQKRTMPLQQAMPLKVS